MARCRLQKRNNSISKKYKTIVQGLYWTTKLIFRLKLPWLQNSVFKCLPHKDFKNHVPKRYSIVKFFGNWDVAFLRDICALRCEIRMRQYVCICCKSAMMHSRLNLVSTFLPSETVFCLTYQKQAAVCSTSKAFSCCCIQHRSQTLQILKKKKKKEQRKFPCHFHVYTTERRSCVIGPPFIPLTISETGIDKSRLRRRCSLRGRRQKEDGRWEIGRARDARGNGKRKRLQLVHCWFPSSYLLSLPFSPRARFPFSFILFPSPSPFT